jgi:hypothetical protein
MDVYISFIPIFADASYSQTNENYYKILLDNDSKIIKKKLGPFHSTVKDFVQEIHNKYLKVDYEWVNKELATCRKINDEMEITYVCRMPYISGCVNDGKLINITNFMSSIMDIYYVEIISGRSPQFFK